MLSNRDASWIRKMVVGMEKRLKVFSKRFFASFVLCYGSKFIISLILMLLNGHFLLFAQNGYLLLLFLMLLLSMPYLHVPYITYVYLKQLVVMQ